MVWNDVGHFDLPESVSTPKPPALDGTYPAQEDDTEDVGYHTPTLALCRPHVGINQGKTVPQSTRAEAKFTSPPVSFPRKKNKDRADQTVCDDSNCASFTDNTKSSLKSTPVKGLPFSPSQV